MISKMLYKNVYELALAYRYKEFFITKKKDHERLKLIKTVIMDKSPAISQSWTDFQTNDQRSFMQFQEDIKQIRKFVEDDKLLVFNDRKFWNTSWKQTWNIMERDLVALSPVAHRFNQNIFVEKDGILISTICDWYIDRGYEHQQLLDKVFDDEIHEDMIKIMFEEWDKVRAFNK